MQRFRLHSYFQKFFTKEVSKSLQCPLEFKSDEQLFRRVYDSNMIGLFFSAYDGSTLEANDVFLSMLGYTREDLKQGKINWRNMTPPEYKAKDLIEMENILRTGLVVPYEKQYFRKDGSRIDILIGAAAIEGLSRFVAVTYVLDISERKRAEKQLRQINLDLDKLVKARTSELVEANQFLDSVLENVPHAIFVKDAKTFRLVRINKAGENIIGKSRDQVLGKDSYELFPNKEEADDITADDRKVAAGGLVDNPKAHITTGSGDVRLLHTKKLPLFASNGELRYILGIAEDITERKRLEDEHIKLIQERASREEEAKSSDKIRILWEATALLSSSLDFKTTLKHIAHAVVPALADYCWVMIKTEDGLVKSLESASANPLKSEILIEISEKFPTEIDAENPVARMLRTGVPDLETDMQPGMLGALGFNPERSVLIQQLNIQSYICVPLKSRGEVVAVLGVATSTDSNRRYSASDLQLMQTLAERASMAIENAKLYEEAQRANRVKDEFLATLSHELRTPLNVILGNSDLLQHGGLSPHETQKAIEAIDRNSKLQAQMVTDLLDLSSSIAGKLSFKCQSILPAEIVRGVLENIEPSAELKSLTIVTHLDYEGAINADPLRFQQITSNLLTNAVKFTPVGGTITLSLKQIEDQCVLRVEDTGKGISTKFLPFVFEPFRQEDSAMNRGYGGLGLGLSIVKSLAEQHSGSVSVESSGVDQGSAFTVRLPIHHQSSTIEIQKITGNNIDKVVNLNGLDILVVEDSDDSRFLIKRFLEKAGAKVYAASSAKEALDHLDREHYDAIVSDISMPEMDGFEFMKVWRSREKETHHFIPAAALTAYARDEEKAKAFEAGFQSHIAKPAQASNLVRGVHDLVSTYLH